MAEVVRAAVRREASMGSAAPYRHRIPIGLLLVDRGYISLAELHDAVRHQEEAGDASHLGAWLVESGVLSETVLTRALSLQWNCPVFSPGACRAVDVASALPHFLAEAMAVLPLRVLGGRTLCLAFSERIDRALSYAVERILGLHVSSGLVRDSEFVAAQAEFLAAPAPPVRLMEISGTPALTRLVASLSQANTLLSDIAQLNLQIESTSPNADAGTLEDQRQQDLTSLSQMIGIRTVTTENNGLTVTTVGGGLLVSEGQAFQITSGVSGGVTHYFDSLGNDITGDLTSGGGELGGILTARDQDIPQAEGALDQLAFAVGTQMNTQNAAGADLNGNAGAPIFSLPTGATAANPTGSAAAISVVMTDPSQIATAAVGQGTSDNQNATALANIANQAIVNGTTATQDFSNFVISLGSKVTEVSGENTAQQAALTQLSNQIGSLSGVNLNDEAAQLETLEQSYQAASKLFTALDQVMTSALNLGVETTYS